MVAQSHTVTHEDKLMMRCDVCGVSMQTGWKEGRVTLCSKCRRKAEDSRQEMRRAMSTTLMHVVADNKSVTVHPDGRGGCVLSVLAVYGGQAWTAPIAMDRTTTMKLAAALQAAALGGGADGAQGEDR